MCKQTSQYDSKNKPAKPEWLRAGSQSCTFSRSHHAGRYAGALRRCANAPSNSLEEIRSVLRRRREKWKANSRTWVESLKSYGVTWLDGRGICTTIVDGRRLCNVVLF